MAMTKAATTLQASASNAAAGTTTGTAVNLTAAYGGWLTAVITNGATGPTLPGTLTVQTSNDNTTYRDAYVFTAGITASTTYTFGVDVPWGTGWIRTKFSGNTVQAVTIAAEIGAVTAL